MDESMTGFSTNSGVVENTKPSKSPHPRFTTARHVNPSSIRSGRRFSQVTGLLGIDRGQLQSIADLTNGQGQGDGDNFT